MKKRLWVPALAVVVSATFAAGVMARPVGEVRFTIENGGSTTLTTVNLSRPDAHAWGQDRLQGRTIAPGESIQIIIQPTLGGCLYDMKAAFDSGQAAHLFAVDVCRLDGAEITLTD